MSMTIIRTPVASVDAIPTGFCGRINISDGMVCISDIETFKLKPGIKLDTITLQNTNGEWFLCEGFCITQEPFLFGGVYISNFCTDQIRSTILSKDDTIQ